MSTPFASRFDSSVADWIDVMGFGVPVAVTSPRDEYDAIRTAVAITDYSMLFKWHVIGPGAVQAVDWIVTRDVAALRPGRIAYGPVVAGDGGMVDDVTVLVLAPDHLVVTGGNPVTGVLLEAAAPTGTTVENRRDATSVISVQGPRSREVLQSLTTTDISGGALPYYACLDDGSVAGVPARISRIGFTAELGYEIEVARDGGEQVWDGIWAAGQQHGIRVWGADALMMCRLEAGFVMLDLEYDATVSPFECRLGWAVELDTAPFLGRDALLARRDEVETAIVSVVIDGGPGEGMPVRADGTVVGAVSMAMPSPHLGGRTLGFARLPASLCAVGTRVTVDHSSGSATAEVVPTPVYDPSRQRVRS
jgi:aminomethyltransferase